MISHLACQLALRGKALTLSVATTGSANLSATATAYQRATGSFLTDGFAVGMELVGTGFAVTACNGAHVVTAVATLTLTCPGLAVDADAAGRTLAVGLPTVRSWENAAVMDGGTPTPGGAPIAGRWFVEEDYLPGPTAQVTVGPLGDVEHFPQYVLKLYGLANTGTTALYKAADALLALFAPRTALTLTTSDVVRVRTDPAPYRSQLLQGQPGWAVVTVTVPCRLRSSNTI